jgi:hypothetical protein
MAAVIAAAGYSRSFTYEVRSFSGKTCWEIAGSAAAINTNR